MTVVPGEAVRSDVEKARLWWDGLASQERSTWGKRFRHIDGEAFRVEAYRKAMDGEG